jgi:hypothetical protein
MLVEGNSTMYFNNVFQRKITLKNDIYCFSTTPESDVYDKTYKTFNCMVTSLEPYWSNVNADDAKFNNDIVISAENNRDLNLLSPGWIMSWSTYLTNSDINIIKTNKVFDISFLFSLRGQCEVPPDLKTDIHTYLHRQYIMDNYNDIKIPKTIYISNWNKDLPKKYPTFPLIPDNKECLYNSMFNIALENSKVYNYYAEKILDCFLSLTIPIYIGCPNIGDYYDKRGIIFAKSGEDIINICNTLSAEKYYSLEEYYTNNYKLVKFWLKYHYYQNLIENYLVFLTKFYNNNYSQNYIDSINHHH